MIAVLRLADLLAGLSRLADLGFGLPAGESLRSCALATTFARKLGLPADDVRATLYTALLHHIGCTGYAHETALLFGDELAVNTAAARTDASGTRDVFATFLPMLMQGRPPLVRARLAFTTLARGQRWGEEYTTTACELGRDAARRLRLSAKVQDGLYHVYELWRGGGVPSGLSGDAIPVASRIARLTGVAALFDTVGGTAVSVEAVRRRGGGMLDPRLADAFTEHADALLQVVNTADPRDVILDAEPPPVVTASEQQLTSVAAVFGDLADLKSPLMHGHSRGVARLARGAAERLNLSPVAIDDLELAGLLHDLGRVAVSSSIWEKPGRLTSDEWEQVRLHAYHSERILAGSERLGSIAELVGLHHERLDGSGYHRGCTGDTLSLQARVLAAADTYQTLTERRPHRAALTPAEAAQRMQAEARRGRHDPDAVSAVLATAGHTGVVARRHLPNGLTSREVEVLRLVAQGATNAEIADRLVMSRRTAEHHVQHAYGKIGVSSRAAAALFVMEHHLLDAKDG